MAPVIVCHQGAPCTPPIVDGVAFQPHPEDPSLYVAECTEEQAANFTRICAFNRFGGSLTALPTPADKGAGTNVGTGAAENTKPIPNWTNADLMARVKETWDKPEVQAKVAELKAASPELVLDKPEDANRPLLIALATAKPAE